MAPIPEFGLPVPGAEYVLRPGGYVVLFNAAGEVAVVATPKGLALPGGGQEAGESPAEAAIRETLEECGLRVTLAGPIGTADELVFAADEARYYRKRCVFFLGTGAEKQGPGEPDRELIWLAPAKARAELVHESQRWAVEQAGRLRAE